MGKPTIVDQYFKAFNAHDPKAVAQLFGRTGKYVDPAVPAGVKGAALIDYLRAHYASFPDSRYRVVRITSSREGLTGFEWVFKGTNAGPLGDAPATNRKVEVPGASMMLVKNGAISWLHGYFDRRAMLRQLGL